MPHALTGGLGGEGAGAGAGAGAGGASSFFAGAGAATTDAAVLAGLSSLLFGVGVHADADAFKPWLEKEVFQSDKCDVQIGKLRLDPHHPIRRRYTETAWFFITNYHKHCKYLRSW